MRRWALSDAPNLTESRWPSIDLQRQPTTEDDHAINAVEAQLAEDEDANPPPRCFVPTARELSDIMEATTNPLTTSWSTMTGSGDEAAKEMPSGLDFGALEYDGVDGELVTNLLYYVKSRGQRALKRRWNTQTGEVSWNPKTGIDKRPADEPRYRAPHDEAPQSARKRAGWRRS